MAAVGTAHRRDSDVGEVEALATIEHEYRELLAEPAVLPFSRWAPVRIGPTWQITPEGLWLLPERTLGWAVLAWCTRWLERSPGEPWWFTAEQARWLLWWYAVDEHGAFLYTDAVLQRLKGWGKDPLGACLCMVELLGPCRFGGWNADGSPIAVSCPEAWVATAAVSQDQTRNTMRLLPTLVSEECLRRYKVQLGKESLNALGDTRRLEAVTSSPRSLQGRRHTLVLLNETHEWVAANEGHAMTDTLTDNAVKSPGGAARTVRITNAYMPGEDSVAERDRDAWAAGQSGEAEDPGILYDSLEAHPEAPLIVTVRRRDDGELVPSDDVADGEVDEPATRDATRLAIVEVINTVRGDASWLSTERILKRVLDVRSPPSRSRRFWFNQVVAAEDAWLDPRDVDRNGEPDAVLAAGDTVVLFGDLSKSDDATGLELCRLDDGFTFTYRVWTPGRRGDGTTVPRSELKRAVLDAAETYRVVACFIDPSAVQDEDTGGSYWLPVLDELHRELGPRLELWATASGARRHAVVWDMRSSEHDRQFTEAAETYAEDTEAGQCPHDAHPIAVAHLKNARRRPNRWGVSLGKEHRESAKKVDLAVCKVGARMLRRQVLNRRAEHDTTTPRTGFVV